MSSGDLFYQAVMWPDPSILIGNRISGRPNFLVRLRSAEINVLHGNHMSINPIYRS